MEQIGESNLQFKYQHYSFVLCAFPRVLALVVNLCIQLKYCFSPFSFYHYKCCSECKKEVLDIGLKICPNKFCGKPIEKLIDTFSCKLEVQTSTEQVIIKVFKDVLPFEIEETEQEEIEAKVNMEISCKFFRTSVTIRKELLNGEEISENIAENFVEIEDPAN